MGILEVWSKKSCTFKLLFFAALGISTLLYISVTVLSLPFLSVRLQRVAVDIPDVSSSINIAQSRGLIDKVLAELAKEAAGNSTFPLQNLVKPDNSSKDTNLSVSLLTKLPRESNSTEHASFPLQYRVKPGSPLKDTNFPVEFRGGSPMLKERTYPKTPRIFKCNKCFIYNYSNVLKPRTCDAPGDIKLLILVSTIPSSKPERDAMRKTWLSLTKNNTASVRYLFLLGSGWQPKQHRAMAEENQQFNDILQDDYIDSYFNLSIKVLSGFKYGLNNCTRAQFIMRSADDNFVNLPRILTLLKEERLQHPIFGRCKMEGDPVDRRTFSKWAVTMKEWNLPRYPPYCVGTTFLMSQTTTQIIYNTSQNVPYYVMEDVYFGEVARQAGVKVLDLPNFLLPVPNSLLFRSGPCPLYPSWNAVHEVAPRFMYLLWNHCLKKKTLL